MKIAKSTQYEFGKAEIIEILLAHLKNNGIKIKETFDRKNIDFKMIDISDDKYYRYPKYDFQSVTIKILE